MAITQPLEDVVRLDNQNSDTRSRGWGSGMDLAGISPHLAKEMLSSLFTLIADDGLSEGFENQACLFLSQWIECDRVILMLDYGPGSQLDIWGFWSRTGQSEHEISPNCPLIKSICRDRKEALLWPLSPGLTEEPVAAAMGVPLFDNGRIRGILYTEAFSSGEAFGQSELSILSATANAIAAKLSARDASLEMAAARRILNHLCPTSEPDIPGYEVAARVESCYSVGGDFYHVGQPTDGKVLVAVGDVAGKGLPAALAMSACTVLIPALAHFCATPCSLVQRIHHSLKTKLTRDQYVTLFLGELDLASGDLRYVNAGHIAPMVLRANGDVDRLGSTGGLVGMFPEFACQGKRTRLAAGDLLTVFSDGVTEATIHGDEFFEREAAEAVIEANREASLPEIMTTIFAEIDTFLKGGPRSDDTTLLLLRREP